MKGTLAVSSCLADRDLANSARTLNSERGPPECPPAGVWWGESTLKPNPVKRALREGKPQVGTWLTLGSVVAARFLARVGFPWLTVDMEHTHTDIQTAALMFGSIADAGCVPLARVPAGKHEWIKMVLDCGAMGI